MTDNVSRLRGVEGYNRGQGVNSISTRLNRITGAGSRSGGVSRGRIYDIAKSSGVSLGANSRLVSNASIASSGRAIRTANARRANVKRGRLSYQNIFDKNKDGTVSDRESMNYLIKLRKNNSERGLAELMQFNQTTQRINENLNNIDSDNDGVISDREAMTKMMADRVGSSSENDLDIVEMILSNNSRKEELASLLARVDTNPDGQISREEVLAVLTEMRSNNLDPALIESLTQVLELNPDLEAIVTEFENSIGSNYVAEQHAEVQVLLTRRMQELQLLNGIPDLMPSALGLLEELAEIYGDEYLSEDETSPDFYKFAGLTGQIEEALLAQGRSIEDLINGQVSQADMELIFGQVIQYSPDQSDDIEASFAEQHQNVVNYLNQARADLSNPLVDVALTRSAMFENIADIYGDLGFPDEGYTGFTGAMHYDFHSVGEADTLVELDLLMQLTYMLIALPGVTEPAEFLTVEEKLNLFADINFNGQVEMADALRLASMIDNESNYNPALIISYAPGSSGETTISPERANFNNGVYDFNGDGTTGPKDLRLLTKYINGARGDALYEETADTIQSYIENILSPENSISLPIETRRGNYAGPFGSATIPGSTNNGGINQSDIAYLTNLVQGNPELNRDPNIINLAQNPIDTAYEKGLLDVNNDGITDMDDVAILQRYVDGARGEDLIDSDSPESLIEQNLNYMNFKQEFYDGQIVGLNNVLEQWQAVNDDTGFARAQIAMISAQIKTTESLQEFVIARSGFWTSESDRTYPTEAYGNREFVYGAMRDLENRYQAALSGESNEDHLAIQVELFKQEVILHNLEQGISIEGLNDDVGDIYNDGELTNQGKAIQSYEFSKFKVNFFNSNIEGLENTLEQWQSVNDDTGFAATQIAAINEQLDKVNQVRDYWDTRDEFWHDQAFLTYDPNQTEVVKNLYLGIADLERRADNSILNGSDEEIDAIQQGIIQLTGVLDAMHGFSFEALTSDEDNQLRVLLHNRIIESILGGTDVGNIFGDQDLDAVLGQIAQIYGDNRTIDSKYGYVPDPVTGAATTEVMQLNTATGQPESVNSDPSLIAVQDPALGAYQFFNADGEVDVDEYTRYQQDYAKAYGGALLDPTDPASAITPPAGRADSEGINAAELLATYTGLTRAIHNEVLDFQQVDSSGTPLPLEIDALYQILYSLENN